MSCPSLNYRVTKNIGKELLAIKIRNEPEGKKLTIHKKLIQKVTTFFDEEKYFDTAPGKEGVLLVASQDEFDAFELLVKWAYTGTIEKCKTRFSVTVMPPTAQLEVLETELRAVFNAHMCKLVNLYCIAEKYKMEDLMNKTIDTIQDGYSEYGTVFGPRLHLVIFQNTKDGSKLRELCVGSVLIHFDKGCSQLRDEVMMACLTVPGYFKVMLKWIAQNFALFGKRESVGFDSRQTTKGFSMFNRDKLCPCQFHVHTSGHVHLGHDRCVKPTDLTCEHADETNDITGFLHSQILGSY